MILIKIWGRTQRGGEPQRNFCVESKSGGCLASGKMMGEYFCSFPFLSFLSHLMEEENDRWNGWGPRVTKACNCFGLYTSAGARRPPKFNYRVSLSSSSTTAFIACTFPLPNCSDSDPPPAHFPCPFPSLMSSLSSHSSRPHPLCPSCLEYSLHNIYIYIYTHQI